MAAIQRGRDVHGNWSCTRQARRLDLQVVAARGGIAPARRRRALGALTNEERETISRGLAAHDTVRTIAQALGRAPSTMSREITRNGGLGAYRAVDAEAAA